MTGFCVCTPNHTAPNVGTPYRHTGSWPCKRGEGIYRSSLDARKPKNPINSEEYQGHLQGVLYST
eukprot:2744725-Pyramimonas_sp.AAC.1